MVDGINENIFLVNAPAGSGKTTWIRKTVEKYIYEHEEDNVLCITYTNRAAEELMKDIDSDKVFFGTIHSFINHFIRSFFSHQSVIDLYWEMYKDRIQERINNVDEKENIKESNQKYIEKHGNLNLETVHKNIVEISYSETPFTSLYRGALSHDDLIIFTKATVDKFPVIKKKIAEKYQLVFIDEYQDTSADVLHIFYSAMKGGKGKMYLLGDKMQQIYKNYDGSFEEQFLELNRTINLTTNYRTTPYIVKILNAIYNDPNLEQNPYEKNKDDEMSFYPKVIITNNPEEKLGVIKQQYEDALVLYLSNKERFYSIQAGNLYESLGTMVRYSFGHKYTAVDVMIKEEAREYDPLLKFLFIIDEIKRNFDNNLYGNVFRLIKRNYKVINSTKYSVNCHDDKRKIKLLFEEIMKIYSDDDANIGEVMNKTKELDFINSEYYDEIMNDEDYQVVLGVKICEVRNLTNYISNPKISTQHGVKGESHDTVIFMAANSNKPIVNMSKFFEMWSSGITDVTLPDFDSFYYRHKALKKKVENIVGVKSSELTKDLFSEYKEEVFENIQRFAQENEDNNYYKIFLEVKINNFLQKKNKTSAQDCLKESIIYGPLSAYRLFYVGCSRARKNLAVIINEKDVKSFKEKLIAKFKTCGFEVKTE